LLKFVAANGVGVLKLPFLRFRGFIATALKELHNLRNLGAGQADLS
jgi:hypothetical protein